MADFTTIHPPELYAAAATATSVRSFAAVTDGDVARYREQGYLVVEAAFSEAEVGAAAQGLLHLIAGRSPEFDDFDIEDAAKAQWPALQGEARQDAVRKLMNFTSYDARLLAVAEHPQLRALLARLMEAAPERFQDMALMKPPRIGREKPWHQDCAYFDLPVGTKVVGVWIALDAAAIENGCMHVLAGAHLEGPRLHFQRRDWQICDAEMLGRSCTAVPLEPGGCLLFDGLLPHGTPHNLSTLRRRALQFHYRPVGVTPVARDERLAVFGGEGRNVSC